jgi:hypothetical protein
MAGEESLALRIHGEIQLCHKTTDYHKISANLFSLFFGFSASNFENM